LTDVDQMWIRCKQTRSIFLQHKAGPVEGNPSERQPVRTKSHSHHIETGFFVLMLRYPSKWLDAAWVASHPVWFIPSIYEWTHQHVRICWLYCAPARTRQNKPNRTRMGAHQS